METNPLLFSNSEEEVARSATVVEWKEKIQCEPVDARQQSHLDWNQNPQLEIEENNFF